MSTKAETLAQLRDCGFNVPPLIFFRAEEWESDSKACIEKIFAELTGSFFAVRSSALLEDGMGASMAGAFCSVLNVSADTDEKLYDAVEQVRRSLPNSDDQIIVQAMVEDVSISGVLMTRTLHDGSPYYVINYDDISGRTDTVTGGMGGSKTVYIYRGVKDTDFDSKRLHAVVSLARNLESVFNEIPLDIEFAVDSNYSAHLLQVRRIVAARNWSGENAMGTERMLNRRIEHVAGFIAQLMTPRHGLFGNKSILGVMPDWNPAEMIGIHPKPLAAGLYRELITHDVWRQARELMGYRIMPPTELMVMVAGVPYIDVRASFNSFLPQGISREAGEKLVDSWLSRLDDNPAFHDKVEFEIVPTVLTPDFEDIFQERYGDILSSVEFVEYRIRLMDLTKKAFNGGSLHSALSSVEKLRNLQENSLLSARYSAETMSPFDIALDLNEAMEHCRSMGTLPFAVIARHAFIAETWLRAAMRAGALSEDRVALLKRSIETISGTLTRDFNAVLAGRMHREIFLHNYGHLRPGMYDILSPSYRERTDLFDAQPNTGGHDSAPAFTFTSNEKNDVESLFSTCGLTLSAESFLRYVGTAVAGREYGKFIFSRHLDHILYLVKFFGCKFNFTPDELSMLTLDDILSLGFQPLPSAGKDYFSERIHAGRGEYDLGRCFKLSWLLRSPRDVYIVPQHRSQPNFIGTEIVDADIAVLTTDGATPEMEGKIVCIESADPGYDWIFTRHIAGLITRYGGTNSHMAIRCAEYGLPAAIGCGEQIFTMAIAAGRLHMDCASKTVRPVDRLWD